MCNDFCFRHSCRVGVPWDVTVCRRLSRVFICLFGSVGSFRVRVFVVDVFVTSGKMATAVLTGTRNAILAEPATTAVHDNVDVIMNGGRCGLGKYSVTSPCDCAVTQIE